MVLSSRHAALLALVAILALGCTEDSPIPPDSGVRDAAPDVMMPDGGGPAAPEAPIPPSFGPCPEGWRAVPSGEGFDVCEPFPEAGRPPCGRDEAFFPGTEVCTPIGTACPVGDFPVDVPIEAPVVYVLGGASGGDGTESSPFGTISEATAVATPGSTIAVGKGTYSEAVSLPSGVTLLGACVAETLLTFDGSSYSVGVIDAAGADVSIRNLRVGGAPRPGITILAEGRSATVEDVVVHDCAMVGISAEFGGALTGERIVIRDISAVVALGQFGRGLNIDTGSHGAVSWLHVEGAKEGGVVVQVDAELTLEDASILDTALPAPTADVGAGMAVTRQSRLVARRVVVEEATMMGVTTQSPGTEAVLEDVVVRRTRPGNFFGGARGMDINEESSLSCTRCLIEDLLETGVTAGASSVVTLRDTLIRRVDSRDEDGTMGQGLTLQTGGMIDVERVVVADLRAHGVGLQHEGSRLTGTDLVIRRVQGEAASGAFGRGIAMGELATALLERVEVSGVREAGVLLGQGASATMADVWVHDVGPNFMTERFGRGIVVQGPADLIIERGRVERVLEFGVAAIGAAATMTATDLSVADVEPQACSAGELDPWCAQTPGGHGIGSYIDGRIEVEHFDVSGVDLCGVHVGEDGTLRLGDGVVRGAAIGACVQSDAQNVADLQHEVRYVDNVSNLEATTLPVPVPLAPAE